MPNIRSGISDNTENRLILDAGAFYRNRGETDEELIGATRGGATFTVEQEIREVEVDGAKGPVKGLRRIVRHTATLELTLIEVSRQTLIDLLRGTEVSDGTHMQFTPDNDIVAADYYTNLALIAEVQGTSDPIELRLLNAIFDGEWSITTDDQDEGEISVTVTAHYTPAALDTVPYSILLPVAAS